MGRRRRCLRSEARVIDSSREHIKINGANAPSSLAEWQVMETIHQLSLYARRKAGSRRLRLFACACCRHIWHLIPDQRSRRTVEIAERFADGLATRNEMAAARAASPGRADPWGADAAAHAAVQVAMAAASEAAEYTSRSACEAVLTTTRRKARAAATAEQRFQSALFDDILGHFTYPIVLDSSLFRWHNACIVGIAQAIYDEHAFERMPILGDALMDAGCDNPRVVEHCQSAGPHARGCWLLDAILRPSFVSTDRKE